MFLMDINLTYYYCIINYILLLFFSPLNYRFFNYINLNILKELFMSHT